MPRYLCVFKTQDVTIAATNVYKKETYANTLFPYSNNKEIKLVLKFLNKDKQFLKCFKTKWIYI